MNDSTHALLPQRLLLATDLCARCDRPLDRARQLALEWQSALTVLTVRDGPATPEEVSSWLGGGSTVHAFELAARRELAADFAGSGVAPTLQVVEGDVTDAILHAAAALTGTDALVIIGASRNESFLELILGSTAERLAQGLAHPLLVVRQRTRGSYARILVANDFSSGSRQALDAALRLFPGRAITLFHAFDPGAQAPAQAPAAMEQALADSERFLDACALPAGVRDRIDIVVGHGRVSEAITRHVVEAGIELVVLGVHRLSGVARVFVGSRSDDLLQHLPCDTLLVRAAEGSDDG